MEKSLKSDRCPYSWKEKGQIPKSNDLIIFICLLTVNEFVFFQQVESSKKQHMSHPIPQSVSRRVRELSTIYPYPRERKSRSQLMGSGTNSTLISTVEMACESSDHGG